MNPRLRVPLIIIGAITIIVIAIFVLPRGLSLYYQIRGGQHIDYVLRFEEGIQELVCEPLSPTNEEARKEVENGIDDLTRAIRLDKNNSQAYYFLGKANCLLGDPGEAKENYLQYTFLRPHNPLGYLGLGFAYEKVGNPISAKVAWETANLISEDFSMIGDEAFSVERYNEAISWYTRADLLEGEQSTSSRFKWGVASVLVGQPFPILNDVSELPIYSLSEDLIVNGSQLHWMREVDKYQNDRYGMQLIEFPTGDPNVGGMWWDDPAVIFVQAPCTAEFSIQARASHISGTDQIGRLQFEDDLIPFAIFPLSEDWQNYEAEILLSKGNHIMGIRYLEDVGDLLIDWLRISQISNCDKKSF